MQGLRTTEAGPRISEDDILKFERKYQLALPTLYRSFLLEVNGGRPERDLFPIEGLRGNPYGRIHLFLTINDELRSNNIDWVRNIYADRVQPNLLLIATTEGADVLCLDLETGTVLFWDAYDEDNTGRRLYKIADSFEEFLNVLYKDERSPKIK